MSKKITKTVSEILAPFLEREGYELYHSEYVKEGKDWYLRVYIDKGSDDEYISTDDCEKVSRFLSDELDRAGRIDKNYYLEVSSPGMDRELVTDEHFERYISETVDVKLYRAFEGEKMIRGELIGKTEKEVLIRIEDGDRVINLPADTVAKVRLAVMI